MDKFLKGANRATCQWSSPKFELVMNLKTAKTLGLTIPVLARADQVIEQ